MYNPWVSASEVRDVGKPWVHTRNHSVPDEIKILTQSSLTRIGTRYFVYQHTQQVPERYRRGCGPQPTRVFEVIIYGALCG